jgi:hypothetical protein
MGSWPENWVESARLEAACAASSKTRVEENARQLRLQTIRYFVDLIQIR